MFAKHREVDVVFHDHGRLQRRAEDGGDGHLIPPRQIRRERDDRARGRVNRAGRPGTNGKQSGERHIGCAQKLPRLVRECVEQGARLFVRRGAHIATRQELAPQVCHREACPGGAKIDGGNEPVPPVELHVTRTAPATRRTGAQIGKQIRADQRRSEAADGGGG